MVLNFKKFVLAVPFVTGCSLAGYTELYPSMQTEVNYPPYSQTNSAQLPLLTKAIDIVKQGSQVRLNIITNALNNTTENMPQLFQSSYDLTKQLWTVLEAMVTTPQEQATCRQVINLMDAEGPISRYNQYKNYMEHDWQQAELLHKIFADVNQKAAGVLQEFIRLEKSKSFQSNADVKNYLNQCKNLYNQLFSALS